ncbi:MAG: glycosyltransferase [Hyphomicrobiaceae bacterium]
MPAHAAGATIAAAVASALAQTWTRLEVVVAADDELDYRVVLAASGIRDPRLVFTRTERPRSGPARARNQAAAASAGDYLAPLDADDRWHPEKLARLIPLARRHGLAADNVRTLSAAGEEIGTALPRRTAPAMLDRSGLAALDCPLFPLIRRDLFAPGYDERLGVAEDVAANIAFIARAGGAMPVLAEPLTDYVQSPASLCNRPGSWRQFEAAYRRIIADVAGEHSPSLADAARLLAVLVEKRERNRRFGAAAEAEPGLSFQDFAARQRS